MKPLFFALLLAIGFCFSAQSVSSAEALQYVPVAVYPNRPESETIRWRAHAILGAKGIESREIGSKDSIIYVPVERAAEALRLLAEAVKAERLAVRLLSPNEEFITPESVLERKKDP